jgi:ABC-type multidrug transport system ATPase subunit
VPSGSPGAWDAPLRRVAVSGVTRTFGATAALRGVDAAFAAGEVVSLEGPNGSGKSTLLGIIGTAIRPSSGSVSYEPAPGSVEALRQQIGWVSHETLAYPDLSARQNVRLAASLYGVEPDAAWGRVVARFGLESFANVPVRQQSRGQRQRVALARALVHEPSMLLLDEPTAGLDQEGVDRLMAVIREEMRRECVVVVVTHDEALATAIATRRVRLERGRVVAAKP